MTEHTLQTQNLSVGYDETTIIEDLNLEIPAHKVSVIIGANGCGKSTLMKTLSRLLKPEKGQVVLDGKAVHGYPSTQLAQMLGLLPQSPTVPEGITVADLVARGRYPYRKFMQNMTKEDYAAVEDALERMGITELANRCVDELSGGQRQRVWIALALAQETDILLLDEPTTYLDIAYQVEILDLLTELNRRKGTTIVMILHDVNLSARYANHLFALCRGKLIAEGKPADVITEELMQKVYQLNCIVMKDPLSGAPLICTKGKILINQIIRQTSPDHVMAGRGILGPVPAAQEATEIF